MRTVKIDCVAGTRLVTPSLARSDVRCWFARGVVAFRWRRGYWANVGLWIPTSCRARRARIKRTPRATGSSTTFRVCCVNVAKLPVGHALFVCRKWKCVRAVCVRRWAERAGAAAFADANFLGAPRSTRPLASLSLSCIFVADYTLAAGAADSSSFGINRKRIRCWATTGFHVSIAAV